LILAIQKKPGKAMEPACRQAGSPIIITVVIHLLIMAHFIIQKNVKHGRMKLQQTA